MVKVWCFQLWGIKPENSTTLCINQTSMQKYACKEAEAECANNGTMGACGFIKPANKAHDDNVRQAFTWAAEGWRRWWRPAAACRPSRSESTVRRLWSGRTGRTAGGAPLSDWTAAPPLPPGWCRPLLLRPRGWWRPAGAWSTRPGWTDPAGCGANNKGLNTGLNSASCQSNSYYSSW